MAKRFMYVAIGVLCLMVSALIGFYIGGQTAQASGVFPVSGIVAVSNGYMLDENGQSWYANFEEQNWHLLDDARFFPVGLPVPVSQIKFFDERVIVTHDNVAWGIGWDFNNLVYEWVDCGPWPGTGVPAKENTWGRIKGTFDGNE